MNPTSQAPAPRRASSHFVTLSVGVVLLGLGLWTHSTVSAHVLNLESKVDSLNSSAQDMAATLRLLRLERGSSGLGTSALIEQIEHWAPLLESASTAAPEAKSIQDRLVDIIKASPALGDNAFAPLEAALAKSKNDESRKWLARAAISTDRDLGVGLLNRLLRGTSYAPSARIRWWAADELLRTDKAIAGEVLAEVLTIESSRGLRQLPPQLSKTYESYIQSAGGFPGFHNFIKYFYASEHKDRASILLQVLGQAEHDQMTYKDCVKYLGLLKAKTAVKTIENLYTNPRGREMQNPFLQEECLTALGEIQGSKACAFYDQALRTAQSERLITKLHYLKAQHCN